MREVVNGLMYVLSTGCQWRAIPLGIAVIGPRAAPHLTNRLRSRCSY